MTETFTLTAKVQKKGDWYISSCLELDISSQGETIEEAVSNLKEAVELYIEIEGIDLPVKRPFLTKFKVKGKKTEDKKTEDKKTEDKKTEDKKTENKKPK